MTRLGQLTTCAAIVLIAVALTASTDTGHETPWAASWGSSYAIADPDPGFWRAQPGNRSGSARTYSAGASPLVAVSRLAIEPESQLELTNMGVSGALVFESGEFILTDAEGLIALQRSPASGGLEQAPVGIGSALSRGDRLAFGASARVEIRNPGATPASLLMITEIAELPEAAIRR